MEMARNGQWQGRPRCRPRRRPRLLPAASINTALVCSLSSANILERFLAQNVLRPLTSSFRGSPTFPVRGARGPEVWKPFPRSSFPSPQLIIVTCRGKEGRKGGRKKGESINFPGGPHHRNPECPADALSPSPSLPVGGRLK